MWKWLKRTFPSVFERAKTENNGGVVCEGGVCSISNSPASAAHAKKRDKRDHSEGSENQSEGAAQRRGRVLAMSDDSEWDEIASQASRAGVPVVVCFTASWCGPCQVRALLLLFFVFASISSL